MKITHFTESHQDITEILLKVALNTITLIPNHFTEEKKISYTYN